MGKMKRKEYERELEKLQEELVYLQSWVVETGARIVIVFEGRDAAGKGGVIKRIMQRVSARVFHVVALPKPSDRQKTQLYMQRYVSHLPAAGEIVLFDRSWYNRAGIEHVLGFCTQDEYERFIRTCAGFEQALVEDGIILLKYWLTVSHEEQKRRFEQRIDDPMRQWKLSSTDLESVRRWYDYSRARDAMFAASDTPYAPWFIVDSNEKRRARLNCISHLLGQIPYQRKEREKAKIPKRDKEQAYDDVKTLASRKFVPARY